MSRTFLDVGDRGAVICDDSDSASWLREILESIEFKCHVAGTAEESIERIAQTSYDLIAVNEALGGATRKTNSVLLHLAMLPMTQRRNAYTILIGESFRTMDAMQAFGNSVHLVVNPADIGNIAPILKRGLADFDRLYSTYNSVLKEAGELRR
jgi:CheY-like chemotaxis protein